MNLIRVGCAGWGISRFTESLFPPGANHLVRYGSVFNCCEVNSSFYRSHKPATWRRWAASVPPHFKFSVKVPKIITHEMKLKCTPAVIREFINQVGQLEEKLGPVLLQLPPSLEFENKTAAAFFANLREQYNGDIVCEPRHVTWFMERADQLLLNFAIARAAADPACTAAAKTPGGANKVAYFRLHGSPRTYFSKYSDQYLTDLWIEITKLSARSKVWCVFDNTAAGAASQNAIQLVAKLGGASMSGVDTGKARRF